MDTIVRIADSLESIAASLQKLAGNEQLELSLHGRSTQQPAAASPSSTLPPPVMIEGSAELPPATTAPAEQPPRRKRRTRAEIEAERAAPAQSAENVADEFAEPATAQPTVTRTVKVEAEPAKPVTPAFDYDVLKASIQKLATGFGSEGRDKAIGLLRSYGVTKADQVPVAEWPAMYEKSEALIAELDKSDENYENFENEEYSF